MVAGVADVGPYAPSVKTKRYRNAKATNSQALTGSAPRSESYSTHQGAVCAINFAFILVSSTVIVTANESTTRSQSNAGHENSEATPAESAPS